MQKNDKKELYFEKMRNFPTNAILIKGRTLYKVKEQFLKLYGQRLNTLFIEAPLVKERIGAVQLTGKFPCFIFL